MTARVICVIDDDQPMRASVVDLLRSAGFVAMPFASGEAFLAWEERRTTSCLVTDVQLDGLSGLDLARCLCRQRWRIPVILITGSVDPAIDAEAKACGVECLLRKPFRATQLIACIERSITS